MKCSIPEISWHNREPVLSIDIQPISEKFYRLATGGADCHVLIWQLNVNDNGAVKIEALSELTRHQKAVNSVRWSPSGQHLATADDDANIIIWQLKTDNVPLLEGETSDKETWIAHKVMRGHKEDIYDLCWSPSGLKLLSGSIDNTAIVWDFTKGKSDQILSDHKGFVQGVAWDPKGQYIATISTDRICRIFDSFGKHVRARIQRGCLSVPNDHYLYNKEVKFFHDDTFKSFFRRLDFSPDGSLLAVPSGHVETEESKKVLNGTFIFAVESWTGPVAILPSSKQCSTVVRFCPLLFQLQEDGPEAIISLPFRMIIAVGTDHDVILYDTQQLAPFAYFRDIHYTRLTDLTWSKDGLLLVASSTDGYCALITFEPNELGVLYVKEESEVEESIMDVSGCEELDKDCPEFVKPKKLNLLEQWAIKTPKTNKNKNIPANSRNNETAEEDTSKRKRQNESDKSEVVCKRIKPIPVDDKNINNENIYKKKDVESVSPSTTTISKKVSSKVGSLINFLKPGSKEKSNEPEKTKNSTSLPPVTIILDEIEARDAWRCEKSEDTSFTQTEIINVDDYTEDFSLHLEDTNSKASQSTDTQKSITKETENSNSKASQSTDTQKSTTKETENSEDCNKSDPIQDLEKKTDQILPKIISESEKPTNKTLTVNPQEKVNVPKRRIPLITLSSPKQKKK